MGNGRDWCDIADEVEVELVVECRIDGGFRAEQVKRIAVGGGTRDGLSADVAAGTRPILDDKLLAEAFGKPWTNQAHDDLTRATGGKTHNDADRPRWIGLRPRDPRHGRKSGCTRCQMQKSTPGNFHRSDPVSMKL
jgi:hypothetical protein